jgi:hypothetical protein
VPRLPLCASVSVIARPLLGRLRAAFERDLIEQSVAERVTKAALAAALVWVAIWWALS